MSEHKCRVTLNESTIYIVGEKENLALRVDNVVGLINELCMAIGYAPQAIPQPAINKNLTVPDLMMEAADTFRERNKVYGDNYKNVGNVMMSMFPKGIELRTAEDFNKWHLFELMVVKMTRFANSNLTHQDSIHDLGVYSFMVEREVVQ
jgi:hypothetical protein